MNLLSSLEKHLPHAASLIEGAFPQPHDLLSWEEKQCDVLCVYGLSALVYERCRSWLDDDSQRRLIFVEDQSAALAQILKEEDAILLLNDLRVKIYFIETPVQVELVARQVAWSGVLLKLETIVISQSPYADPFFTALRRCHKAAGLILSDAADWGCTAARNAKVHIAAPFRSLTSMKGHFQSVPAILVGAGPSLKKQRDLLASLSDRALIFSCESAREQLPIEPHFVAAIDPHPSRFEKKGGVLCCTQARCHPSRLSADLWVAPDSHFPFLNWLFEQHTPLDGGWTVGTFMIAVAHLWGCNPIVWIGMDHAYEGEQKYAGEACASIEGLVQTKDRDGNWVWTQNDWLFAKEWIEVFAGKNLSTRFIDANERGLSFAAPIVQDSLSCLFSREGLAHSPLEEHTFASSGLLKEKIKQLQATHVQSALSRWQQWKESLQQSLVLCQKRLEGKEVLLEEQIAYTHLLSPLWAVWRFVFERELDLDPHKLTIGEKLRLNETLFFQQVIQEHLDVCG